jgi:hypothetical protein
MSGSAILAAGGRVPWDLWFVVLVVASAISVIRWWRERER